MNKEVNDALHTLLSMALENKKYTTQKEQFDIVHKEIERLNSIIKEVREMLEHKVEFHENLDFYKDKLLETHIYYNFVACLQDFDEIVEKYKVEENK